MKHIIRSAPARVALIGNPFDIYGGSTIALTLKNIRSYVFLEKTENYQNISSKILGKDKLVKKELEYAVIKELGLQDKNFNLFDICDVPYETGFAGSTAKVIAMIRVFNDLFNLEIKGNKDVAELAWKIERTLGVCGGQERYSIAFDDRELGESYLKKRIKEKKPHRIDKTKPGRLVYMDFSGREYPEFTGKNYAKISELKLPSLKLAAAYTRIKKSSFSYHQRLREIFENNEKGGKIILKYRDRSVLTTNKALKEFQKKNPSINLIANCMSQSLNLRLNLFNEIEQKFDFDYTPKEILKMKKIAEDHGAYGINQPGSESIIFLYDDEKPINALKRKNYYTIKINN